MPPKCQVLYSRAGELMAREGSLLIWSFHNRDEIQARDLSLHLLTTLPYWLQQASGNWCRTHSASKSNATSHSPKLSAPLHLGWPPVSQRGRPGISAAAAPPPAAGTWGKQKGLEMRKMKSWPSAFRTNVKKGQTSPQTEVGRNPGYLETKSSVFSLQLKVKEADTVIPR